MEIVVPASVDAVLAAAAAEDSCAVVEGQPEQFPARSKQDATAASVMASGRPSRGAAKGVAAAVSAAAGSCRKRPSSTGEVGDAAAQRGKARRSGARRAPSVVSSGAAIGTDSGSGRASDSVQSLDTHSEQTVDEDQEAAEIVAMMAAAPPVGGSGRGGSALSAGRLARRSVGDSRRPSSPDASDVCSDAFDAYRRATPSPSSRTAPSSLARSNSKARTSGAGSQKGRSGSGALSTGAQVQKRQPGLGKETAIGAGRTRPTNNQLLYKAHFRWEHYPYKVAGDIDLKSETEACASVTSAFLQVLSSLHEAESQREDAPRNILRLLSTNTRRTKVVELTSGTHRVPDELRRHCLTDVDGGQYSTNLDRNRYGSDNQYLNTVIRYDLDFLGLCPGLVDVEIIDAKNADQSKLIRAEDAQCCCGCEADNEPAGHVRHASGSGFFDILVEAATADADACTEDARADEDGEVPQADDASSEQSTEMEASGRAKADEPARTKPLAGKMRRNESVTSMAHLAAEQGPSAASAKEIAELRAQLAAAQAKASQAEAAAAQLAASELQAKLVKGELEALQALKAQMANESLPEAAIALQQRCSALETRVAIVTQERDTHAAAHSYYAVWVQQLQAEVTNLLKVAHANGGAAGAMFSPQLVNLTQAVSPAALASSLSATAPPPQAPPQPAAQAPVPAAVPPAGSPAPVHPAAPSEAEAEAILRAQYERQVQELLQQHLQAAGMAQQAAQQTQPQPMALPARLVGAVPHGHPAMFVPVVSAPAGAMEITPLQHLRPAAPASPEAQKAADTVSNASSDASAATPLPAPKAEVAQ